jgi:hypothetical protein
MSAIHKATDAYINDLDALRGMLEPLMMVTEVLGRKVDEEHLQALEEHGEETEAEGSIRNFNIPPEHMQKIRHLKRKNDQYRTATQLLPRTFLVSFVSTFDAFLGNLVNALFQCKPEVLNASGKQLTYKELISFPDLEAARTHVADSEVESLLRKSHSEQFDWLEKTFDIKLREGLERWPLFIELTERRNLFVHCHGKASTQYLKVCTEHKVDTTGISVGKTLDAKREYLVEAYKCLYEIGVKLSQVMWRKIRPQELEEADNALITITFELLVLEKYDTANRLLNFAAKLPRYSSEVTKRIFLVNLAQSYKFQGNQEQCLSTLSTIDWSACSDKFAVCVAVLKDRFNDAAEIMRRMGNDGPIRGHEYIDWPVFKEFRKSTEFSAAYAEIFGAQPTEQLKHDSTPSNNEPNDDGVSA